MQGRVVYSGSSHVIDNFAPGYLHRESGQRDGKGFNLKLLYFLQRHPSQGDAVFCLSSQSVNGVNQYVVSALPNLRMGLTTISWLCHSGEVCSRCADVKSRSYLVVWQEIECYWCRFSLIRAGGTSVHFEWCSAAFLLSWVAASGYRRAWTAPSKKWRSHVIVVNHVRSAWRAKNPYGVAEPRYCE